MNQHHPALLSGDRDVPQPRPEWGVILWKSRHEKLPRWSRGYARTAEYGLRRSQHPRVRGKLSAKEDKRQSIASRFG